MLALRCPNQNNHIGICFSKVKPQASFHPPQTLFLEKESSLGCTIYSYLSSIHFSRDQILYKTNCYSRIKVMIFLMIIFHREKKLLSFEVIFVN